MNPWAFKTGAFNRSAISPLVSVYNHNNLIQPKKRVIFFQNFAFRTSLVLVHPTKSQNIEIRLYYEKTFSDRGSGFVG